jgi:hypothetical protein
MNTIWLRFTLKSDATFGSGASTPGLIDQEVMVDGDGSPYLHGRTLKGLLNEVCADILFSLGSQKDPWKEAADRLLGAPGSRAFAQGVMKIGHARLPSQLRGLIRQELDRDNWSRADILHSLTTIREQTAMNPDGSPEENSLRTARLILRETPFESRLDFTRPLDDREKGLLAACIMGFRRAGAARNRGRGRLEARLETADGKSLTNEWYQSFFKKEVASS